MDYKTRLQTNNIDLDSILNTINSLPEASGGGIDTSDATATPSDMAQGATAYVNGEKIEGTLSELKADDQLVAEYTYYQKMNSFAPYEFVAPIIKDTILRKDSLINVGVPSEDFGTATKTKVLSGATFTSSEGMNLTGTIPSQNAKTVTPKKSIQTAIAAGTYASGAVTVAAIPDEYITTTDADATAADIAKDKTAYVNGVKVIGTHECTSGGTSGGIDTSDATATAEDIVKDKTAYVNGEKVTGTMEVCSYYVSNVEPSASLGEDGDLCLVRAGE